MSAPLLITVLGPTASGKTAFAAKLASFLDGEIISADSRQVYRKMDIGTGKDYGDYIVQGRPVPFHLIDIVDAGYRYSLFEYQRDFKKVWEGITARGRQPVLCGGSGMYLESVLEGYKMVSVPHDMVLREKLSSKSDAELAGILSTYCALHNVSDTSSRKRLIRAIEIGEHTRRSKEVTFSLPEFRNVIFGLGSDRRMTRERITARLQARLDGGLVGEVEQLLDSGLGPQDLIYYGLEYRFVTLYLTGKTDYRQMKEGLNTAIHQFAKRQMTWFRKMERSGYRIQWLDHIPGPEEKLVTALEMIDKTVPS